MLAILKKLFQPSKLNAALAWASIQSKAGNQANSQDKRAYWLYALPVHLALQRDSFSLVAPVPLPLEKDEADALTALFNEHFAADSKVFFWHEDKWFLSLQVNPNIQTNPPQAAINKDISAYLPTGEGAMRWASFSNEIQMLLFEHPINQEREAKGQLALNSIWCYGGGI